MVTDYVKKKHRGKAIALQSVGTVIGELFTYGILYNLAMNMKYEVSFFLASTLIIGMAFLIFFIVKDPNLHDLHMRTPSAPRSLTSPRGDFEDLSLGSKILKIVRNMYRACKRNIVLPISLLGVIIMKPTLLISNIFIMLWLTNFVDNGTLTNDNEAKTIV